MTFEGLMDTIKVVFQRACSGPLKDRAWRAIRTRAGPDLQRMMLRNAASGRLSYEFHVLVDSNGAESFHSRSMASAREGWLRRLVGHSAPQEALEVSASVNRRNGARAVVEITAVRRSPSQLAVARGSSDAGAGARAEGTRAGVRGGTIDREALARLSGGMRSTAGQRRVSQNVPEAPAGAT